MLTNASEEKICIKIIRIIQRPSISELIISALTTKADYCHAERHYYYYYYYYYYFYYPR